MALTKSMIELVWGHYSNSQLATPLLDLVYPRLLFCVGLGVTNDGIASLEFKNYCHLIILVFPFHLL